MSKLFLTLLLAGGLNVAAFAATTTKLTVNGMVCAFCAQGIEKRLTKLPATKGVFVDLQRGLVAVEAKDGQTLDPKVLKHEITEAGYDVTKTEVVSASIAEVKAQTLKESGKAKK